MSKEIVSRPLLKTAYMSNRRGEKVNYLEISEKIDRDMILNDVNNSGKHFESSLKYIDKENQSRMIFISAETQELGLMAVTYIAGALGEHFKSNQFMFDDGKNSQPYMCAPQENEKKYYVDEEDEKKYYTEEDFECWDEENWIECEGRIPIIHASEAACFYSHNYLEVDFGMTLKTGRSEDRNDIPYWAKCHKEAICILLNECMSKSEIDILNKFSTNKRVYVIFAKKQNSDLLDSDMLETLFTSSESEINSLKNKAVLYNSMDEVNVFISEGNRWKYFSDITKQVFREHGIVNTKIIPYDKIVTVAENIAPANMCTAIHKIVAYSIKDYKKGSVKRLKKNDFDFLDQFENRKKLGTKKASEKLESEIMGLSDVKRQVKQTVNVLKFNKIRNDMGIVGEKYHNVHVMLGAPGTAKTTVAKLMGEIMTDEGLLPGKRSIVVNGAQLKGEYVGQSAPKTHALFESFDIIIIDEAYSMVDTKGGADSFSNEAISQLIIELENHATDKLVIFAGYGGQDLRKEDNKMQLFLEANPGIQSRITSTFYFPSYTPDEMVDIFIRIAKRNKYNVDEKARKCIKEYFETRVGLKNFGNGREARNLLDACTVFFAERVVDDDITTLTKEKLMNISVDDVEKAVIYLNKSFTIRNNIRESKIGFNQ